MLFSEFSCMRNLVVGVLGIVLTSCGPSFPSVSLRPDYPFSAKRTVGVYVMPSGQPDRDGDFGRVLQLDLITRGYRVVDINKGLDSAGISLSPLDHTSILGQLRIHEKARGADIIAIAKCRWDTVVVPFDVNIRSDVAFPMVAWKELHPLQLRGELGFYDMTAGRMVLGGAGIDTQYIYVDNASQLPTLAESPWMVAARQIRRTTEAIPAALEEPTSATHQFSVIVYVDNVYRRQFGDQWEDRLRRRFLFANDILRREMDLELIVREFRPFDSGRHRRLDEMLRRLQAVEKDRPGELRILFTVDRTLQTNWRERSLLGLANPLLGDAVLTAQPSLPALAGWNSIEEALTIVHEVGHVFGALHSPFPSSVMYYLSGAVSHSFDEHNRRIVELMKRNLYRGKDDEAIRAYVDLLEQLRTTEPKNGINILEPSARAALRLQPSAGIGMVDTAGLSRRLISMMSSPALRDAVQGYLAYRMEKMEKAEAFLMSAVTLQPDFAEAHWYLSLVHARLGHTDLYERHKKTSQSLRPPWMLGE
ncbi:MAG: hypothetical protein A3C56_05190 [Ignavibacteria bacterium RIFCSPHIGHO2_02_FULL_56_12]|nr:MAG: hypothetical protein A3C56_05190 [Ignavibacteria bacterium RIFCSPHIGHO2_02_FULL_56_12]